MDIKLALMAGTDLPVPECLIVLHQPKIKEIAFMGEKAFFEAVQCLTINKSLLLDENQQGDINNFQIFMMMMQAQEIKEQKDNVLSLFSLILPKYKVSFTPRSLMLLAENESITIDENNFDAFQDMVKEMFCVSKSSSDAFNPKDAKAKEIADKLMRGRKRIAAQNADQNTNIFTQYVSVLTVGLGSMSLEDCLNLTMYQILDLVQRFGMYMNWDLDIRARMAGAKGDGQPDNWMKSIH